MTDLIVSVIWESIGGILIKGEAVRLGDEGWYVKSRGGSAAALSRCGCASCRGCGWG